MKKLQYNDKVIVNGKKGTVFTVRGFAKKYNDDPEKTYERAINNNHNVFGINQEATVLSGDPNYYENEKKKWENAIHLEDGEIVEIEGEKLQMRYKGNYSDMCDFYKV